MIHGLENLTDNEVNFLLEVPVLITILIGDADQEVDQYEQEWGAKITKFRSVKGHKDVQDYYRHVEPIFAQKLKERLDKYSRIALNSQYVIKKVTEDLAHVNPILKKLPKSEAITLYESFKSFAVHIARASGGFLNFGSISPSEYELLDLPMIENPADYQGDASEKREN